jgi:hypothetical protein
VRRLQSLTNKKRIGSGRNTLFVKQIFSIVILVRVGGLCNTSRAYPTGTLREQSQANKKRIGSGRMTMRSRRGRRVVSARSVLLVIWVFSKWYGNLCRAVIAVIDIKKGLRGCWESIIHHFVMAKLLLSPLVVFVNVLLTPI